jgi:probable phosphoglycerate mutase
MTIVQNRYTPKMQDSNKTTRFGLIRHAQTVWNREKKIQGHSDSPLTEYGEKQASNWGRILSQILWDRILASDSGRALTTAELINSSLKLPLNIDARFREQDWGRWVGKTVTQIKKDEPHVLDDQINAGWDFRPPGGESRRGVLKRSREALSEAAEKYPGEMLLVVAHEGVVKGLIYHLCGRDYLPGEPAILKTHQLHWLAFRDSLHIEKINAIELGP